MSKDGGRGVRTGYTETSHGDHHKGEGPERALRGKGILDMFIGPLFLYSSGISSCSGGNIGLVFGTGFWHRDDVFPNDIVSFRGDFPEASTRSDCNKDGHQ
mgnify:CR=1 FL=1